MIDSAQHRHEITAGICTRCMYNADLNFTFIFIVTVGERETRRASYNKNKTANLQRRVASEAQEGSQHLKTALSWIAARKLPSLRINDYVYRGCHRELCKIFDIHMEIYTITSLIRCADQQ